jgi:DNA replication protein DnaC
MDGSKIDLDSDEVVVKTMTCPDCGIKQKIEFDLWMSVFYENVETSRCEPCQKKVDEETERIKERERVESIIKYRQEKSMIVPNLVKWDKSKAIYPELPNWIWKNKDKSIFIAGPNRIGKSRALSATGDLSISKGIYKSVRYWKSTKLKNRLTRLATSDFDEAERFKEEMINCDLLIIDDIGKEKFTEFGGQLLFEIIDDRNDLEKPMWISSNFSGRELEEKLGDNYGPAVVGRLKECCVLWTP